MVQVSHKTVDLEGSYRRKTLNISILGEGRVKKCPSWRGNRSQYTAVRVAQVKKNQTFRF